MGAVIIKNYAILMGPYVALGYVFFSTLPYATAGKHICTFLMAISIVLRLLQERVSIKFDALLLSFFGLILASFIAAVLGPYPLESLNVFRKETIPFAMALALLLSRDRLEFQPKKWALLAFWALICGYIFREGMAVWDATRNNFYSVYEANSRATPKYLEFFATDTILYLPYLIAALFFFSVNKRIKAVLVVSTIVAMVFVVISGSRTSFLLMLVSFVVFGCYKYWIYKVRVFVVISIFLALAALSKPYIENQSVARLYSIFSPTTYNFGADQSVSGRQAIALATWEISKEHLLLGYGPGWKKLPRIAIENGFMERWQISDSPVNVIKKDYFSFGEGRVNPHNFYLQILFEVGIIGLIAYLSLLLSLVFYSLRELRRRKAIALDDVGIALASTTLVLVTLASGFSGGVWLPPSMLIAILWVEIGFGEHARR